MHHLNIDALLLRINTKTIFNLPKSKSKKLITDIGMNPQKVENKIEIPS